MSLETAGCSVCKEAQNTESRSVAAELPRIVGCEHTGLGNSYDTGLCFRPGRYTWRA
jgi:hypothetical protein